jgi:hypothetical protein
MLAPARRRGILRSGWFSSRTPWPQMEAGTLGEQISPWGAELFRMLKTIQHRHAASASRATGAGGAGWAGQRPLGSCV